MADPALSAFVKDALAAGRARDDIVKALCDAGWAEDQAKGALAAFAEIDFPVPVPRPRRYGSAREAFLYIVYFSLLGMVSGNIVSLAFAFIDHAFADALTRAAFASSAYGLRWALATLLVGFPIFLFLGWRLATQRRADPERRSSRLRAWLTYVTLIFAAGALIGDLIAVVYQFLAGGIGARFLLKAGVVGLVSGVVLFNYVRDAERRDAQFDRAGQALAVAATVIAATLVIWGFAVVKGPDRARALIADERRLSDLGVLARLIDCHASYFGAAPESLEAMSRALSERIRKSAVAPGCAEETPADPATGAPYAYRRTGEDAYRLCAGFAAGWPESAVRSGERRRPLGDYYRGGEQRYVDLPAAAGETCFDLKTDKFPTKTDDAAPDDGEGR